MPYFVYKITQPTPILKNLEHLDTFEVFKEAKLFAREKRNALPLDSGITIKVIFAASTLDAEETLQTKREKSITMEWEK